MRLYQPWWPAIKKPWPWIIEGTETECTIAREWLIQQGADRRKVGSVLSFDRFKFHAHISDELAVAFKLRFADHFVN